MRFEGKSVVVTGAGSGIGEDAVRLFAAEGARVVGADVKTDTIPGVATAVQCDVSRPEDVEALIARTIADHGRIDILCNNAGIVGSTTDVIDCTVEDWDRAFAVNVRGVFLGCKYALPHMIAQGSGSIVNTASVAGLAGFNNRAAYGASKGAVIALTKQVATQYAGTGVRCNCICPGTTDSPWVQRLLAEADDPPAMRAQLIARQPLGRLGEPDEMARAILYLASDDAAFVTGTALVIDGGIMARG